MDSGSSVQGSSKDGRTPSYVLKQDLNAQISAVDSEIVSIDTEIKNLQKLRKNLIEERHGLVQQRNAIDCPGGRTANGSGKGKNVSTGINYSEEFEWTGAIKARMRTVFKIDSFRLCQEAVCNANMDNRDIVCVMPTGGGKSLTYQLPALLSPGCTLVISPLISLMTDQIIHLREAEVEAVMLTGSTSKETSREITSRLTCPARDKEIKLCYVTPEKIARSKTFTSVLQKMASAGRLARIVIDEAHCVSQLGHDFRPDYKKLSILRTLFPNVPILALSATCPPAVLKDLLEVLRLKAVVDGSNAPTDGTVYFSAPLYRKNLHYKVLPKPSSAGALIQTMTNYILEHHRTQSGIIYCLSKKDTETVAAGIAEISNGKIKTGIYHADVPDRDKENLHKQWRNGDIQVVCATIAFGLGIDMATVRFVLHHSMSKSLDGFYQESGRAGRDGKDADCVLYYRGQDASRLSALTCSELSGQKKLHEMLRFAQNVTDCRKVLFANYFSASSSLSLSSWTSSTAGALIPCGHCDNCTRDPETLNTRDVTLECWQILKIMQEIEHSGGRVTLGMMADLIRGAGGGSFGVVGNSRQGNTKAKEKIDLDLNTIAGGKVTLNKDDAETLLIQLLLSRYLQEDFHSTAYSINVYLVTGPQAMRLTRLTREAIQSGTGQRIECTFLKRPAKKSAASAKGKSSGPKVPKENGNLQSKLSEVPDWEARKKKRKRAVSSDGESSEDIENPEEMADFIIDDDEPLSPQPKYGSSGPRRLEAKRSRASLPIKAPDSDAFEDDIWIYNMDDIPANKQTRRKRPRVGPGTDDEVVILSE